MTRKVHDQFSKGLLDGLLSQAGLVQVGYTLSSEVKEIDVLFQPDAGAIGSLQSLGLLGRLATTLCLIEPYRNPVGVREVQICVNKVLEVCNQQERQAKQQKIPRKQLVQPRLWILSPTASVVMLDSFGAQQREAAWVKGCYFLPDSLRTAIVVLHQLPLTLDTLWLRLMARGAVQSQAVSELLALSTSDAFRKVSLHHLANLQLIMKTRQKKLSKDEQELMANLQPAYEVWERETIERGRQEGRQEERQLILARTVPVLLQAGLSIDQIAQQLQVEVVDIRQAAQQN